MTKKSNKLKKEIEYNHRSKEQKELESKNVIEQTGSFDWIGFFLGMLLGFVSGIAVSLWISYV
jgi:hypothetical protein